VVKLHVRTVSMGCVFLRFVQLVPCRKNWLADESCAFLFWVSPRCTGGHASMCHAAATPLFCVWCGVARLAPCRALWHPFSFPCLRGRSESLAPHLLHSSIVSVGRCGDAGMHAVHPTPSIVVRGTALAVDMRTGVVAPSFHSFPPI
jgi:hypothetical protein